MKCTSRFLFPLLLVLMLLTQGCGVMGIGTGSVPRAADSIAEQMDKQIMERFGEKSEDGSGALMSGDKKRELRDRLTIMATVPVDINNLEVSCALARQMSEEVSRWLVNAGYKVQELRKGKEIFFQPKQGEMILTRNTKLLATRTVSSEAVLTGTYVISPDQVRFSMRLIHTPSNGVLAMGTATVPISEDVRPLLVNTLGKPVKVTPSIGTELQ